jgi:ABC-2 type transport system permease protein
VAVPAASLLTAILAASAGVLVSLRASTVRQASQVLSIAVMLFLFVPVFGVQALPSAWKAVLIASALAFGPWAALGGFGLVVAALDALVISLGVIRFKRARLILD